MQIFYRKSTDEMRRNVVKNEGFFLDQKAGSCEVALVGMT